jgi:hypothetical protein
LWYGRSVARGMPFVMHHIDISYVEAVETLPKSRKSVHK